MTELIALSVGVLLLIIICAFALVYAFAGLYAVFSEIANIRKELDAEKKELEEAEQHKMELYRKISESLGNTERKDKR